VSDRVIVTGATGFIGAALLGSGSGRELVPLAGDLTDPAFANALPWGAAAVIHLARSRRQHDPDGAGDMRAVNVEGTRRLLDWAASGGARRFVLASTASVYAASREPVAEDARIEPGDLYSETKREAENLLDERAGALEAFCLRVFTPYGPGQSGQLVSGLIERVRSGRAIEVQGERGLLLSPILASDVAAAFLRALELPAAETTTTVNVGGPDQLGIGELGEIIGAALGVEPAFERVGGPEPGGYLAERTLARELGIPEPAPFVHGVRLAIARSSRPS
jgi:nucleoside-diphosphate-sugar epimerase